jgi:signal peptidase II
MEVAGARDETYRIGRNVDFRILQRAEPEGLRRSRRAACTFGRNRNVGGPMQVVPQRRWLWGPLSPVGAWFAVGTLALDQASKWWILAIYQLQEGQKVVVTPFLNFVYVKNLGISYGLLPLNSDLGQRLLAAFAGLAVLAMAAWLAYGVAEKLVAASLGLIMGGAVGNAIDRLVQGGVADFIQLHAFGFYWYVFNIADAAIVAGVCGLLYESFVVSRNRAAKSP